jgi:hypothetical protein
MRGGGETRARRVIAFCDRRAASLRTPTYGCGRAFDELMRRHKEMATGKLARSHAFTHAALIDERLAASLEHKQRVEPAAPPMLNVFNARLAAVTTHRSFATRVS